MPVLPVNAENSFKIMVNQNLILNGSEEQQPVIIGNRTYVPLRIISENLGTKVSWNSEKHQVIISTGQEQSSNGLSNNSSDVQIIINGNLLNISEDYGKAFISASGVTMIPLRAVGEALNCEVNWQETSQLVSISSKDSGIQTPLPTPTVSSNLLQQLSAYHTNLRLLDGSIIDSSELVNKSDSDFSDAQISKFKGYLQELQKYKKKINLPNGKVINSADLSIQGESIATASELTAWINSETPRLQDKMEQQFNRELAPIPDLAELYLRIGAEYGIRGDLAFCQAAKETNFWQFTGDVKPFQNNYCGLYATGSPLNGSESYNGADPTLVSLQSGLHGATFVTPEAGVEAHIQHLYAYACNKPLPDGKTLCDPRFNLVQRGVAPTWQKLNGRWAVPGTTYGQSIIQDWWLKTLSFN